MKTARCRRVRLAGIASLAFAMGGSRAAMITETEGFTIQAPSAANFPPQTVTVSTPQFNPTLGTFENGTTAIAGGTSIALEFFNTGAGGPYEIVLSDTLSLDGIPGLFEQELTGIVPADRAAFITAAAMFPFGPVERSDPAGMVAGSGTWDQLFSLPFPSLKVKEGPPAALPGIIISGSSVTTYTYTALTPVPEPRYSFVLAVLFGLGVMARKRRLRRALCHSAYKYRAALHGLSIL